MRGRHKAAIFGSDRVQDPQAQHRFDTHVERAMRTGWKSALAVLALAGTALAARRAQTMAGPMGRTPTDRPPIPIRRSGYGQRRAGVDPPDNYPPQNYPPQDNGYGYPNPAPGYAPDDPYAPPADVYASGPYLPRRFPNVAYPNYAPPPGGVALDYNSGGYCDTGAAPTITGTCRSFTARCFSAATGMTARSITATAMADGNSGSMAAGIAMNGADRIPTGGMLAGLARRWG